jgi:diaminopimelate decarboxylase
MFKLHVQEEFYLLVSVDERKAQHEDWAILDVSIVRGRPNLKKATYSRR